MSTPSVASLTNLVHDHQRERDDFGNAVVAHLLEVPGMNEIFDTEASRTLLGQQITGIIEAAVRAKMTMPEPEPMAMPSPEVLPEPEPSDGNGSSGE